MTAKFSCLLTRHCNLRTLLLGVVLLVCRSPHAVAQTSLLAPNLSSDTEIANAGFYRLHWQTPDPGQIQLQEAKNPSFANARLRYEGPDDASVISGMPNGTWYYRAREVRDQRMGPWSETVKVVVAHHPLSRAFTFFTMGVLVFIATLLMVVRGVQGGRDEQR